MKLLVLSNGHGEDVIAVRILEKLQDNPKVRKLAVLPLVGLGEAYKKLNIPLSGTVQKMPSGGFIYMDGKQLWHDVKGGLIKLTLAQYQTVRQWGKTGGKILAVGDIVPLLLAYLSGADYAFVGTAKSEYYIRDEYGWLPQTPWLYRWSGCYYLPWERFLLSRPRCKAVFARDTLTSNILSQWPIPVFDLGNPMMDGMEDAIKQSQLKLNHHSLTILLLPGSRIPEAEHNWQSLMIAVDEIITTFRDRQLVFLAAIAPGLSVLSFQDYLLANGWVFGEQESPQWDANALTFTRKDAKLIISQNAYSQCLGDSQIAIAMAGTATEQFVGLGKPAFIIPGKGPQFTETFAQAQTRLLGVSVTLVPKPQLVPGAIQSLFRDPDRWLAIAENGPKRMGLPGAGERIAKCVLEKL